MLAMLGVLGVLGVVPTRTGKQRLILRCVSMWTHARVCAIRDFPRSNFF
jgi:hypothetical protein